MNPSSPSSPPATPPLAPTYSQSPAPSSPLIPGAGFPIIFGSISFAPPLDPAPAGVDTPMRAPILGLGAFVIGDLSLSEASQAPPLAVADAPPLAVADAPPLAVADAPPLAVADAPPLAVADAPPLAVADAPPRPLAFPAAEAPSPAEAPTAVVGDRVLVLEDPVPPPIAGPRYICCNCDGRQFQDQNAIKRHNQRRHRGYGFQCGTCGSIFKIGATLRENQNNFGH